ncbi:stage III sporulation protein AA [Caloramator quimbayensis]|uniref:Stage III sporulation protein AA n=1 Tax=Caloramator quimbayensis TaxID=1147123 RepID=A0A1T4WXP1_9CLOT|nr:stage III sporulation protein AA [Caloramator quimbayensis]SKA81917.1 stage III sporulation protein AA [Caloramator quimbayensis]
MTDDKSILETLKREILPLLSQRVSLMIERLSINDMSGIEEIRMRADKPLMIFKGGEDFFLGEQGLQKHNIKSFIVERNDIERTLQLMSDFSIYAVEEDLKQGFLTLKGGHRVGIVGRIVLEENRIKTVKNISSLNIRVAREVKGCGISAVKELYCDGVKHTLIVSPPGCGKTTLLRDIIRILSCGCSDINLRGYKVGIVDERSEIAGCYLGIPQKDVGIRTDVIDACPKVQGIFMLLRSMSPEIIAVDEIGSLKDAQAIEEAINSGVKVIATVHGKDMDEVLKRPGIKSLMENEAFERVVILSRKRGPGTIDKIIKF